ncbi:MAG: hypothetical protein WCX88_01945 [Patescibacteria group bacterium]
MGIFDKMFGKGGDKNKLPEHEETVTKQPEIISAEEPVASVETEKLPTLKEIIQQKKEVLSPDFVNMFLEKLKTENWSGYDFENINLKPGFFIEYEFEDNSGIFYVDSHNNIVNVPGLFDKKQYEQQIDGMTNSLDLPKKLRELGFIDISKEKSVESLLLGQLVGNYINDRLKKNENKEFNF